MGRVPALLPCWDGAIASEPRLRVCVSAWEAWEAWEGLSAQLSRWQSCLLMVILNMDPKTCRLTCSSTTDRVTSAEPARDGDGRDSYASLTASLNLNLSKFTK